ncbi:hypothetical protein ACWDG1_48715 [Streptomyces sp. NPDC001177]
MYLDDMQVDALVDASGAYRVFILSAAAGNAGAGLPMGGPLRRPEWM